MPNTYPRHATIVLIFIFFFSLIHPPPALAYTTNMSASVVLGQPDFVSNESQAGLGGPTATNFIYPWGICVYNNRLIVSDRNLNRILIWNSIPTQNNQAADVVLGQPDFTTDQGAGVSATRFDESIQLSCTGGKLFMADEQNSRILIWNSIPTVNNTPADVVIGQTSMTANSVGTSQNTLRAPRGVYYDGNKLFIGDSGNHRVLIFNSVPTANGASADVVVGQTNFTSGSGNAGQCGFNLNFGVYSDGTKLYVSDFLEERYLIFNTIPATNGACADVVVGQPNFTASGSNQNGSVGPNTVAGSSGFGVFKDRKDRLFIGDNENNRVLIFNSVPSTNNASADMVLGQPNMTSNTINNGGVSASSIYGIRYLHIYENKLFVSDTDNHRVLIFEDILREPGLTLNKSPEGTNNGLTRLTGKVTVGNPYTVSSVQYSINGGGLSSATATDGSFNSISEEFYFDFDPKSNQPKDSSGNLIDGYTVRVKSTNTNLDETDRLFYFQPFSLNEPLDNTGTSLSYPTFDFSVSKQRQNLKDNLSKYQIQIKKGGNNSNTPWETIIDDIPVDFSQVQTSSDNLRRNDYWNKGSDNGSGVFETNKLTATYSHDSSRIKVSSKIKTVSGNIQWKVVAVDKSGHTQDSDSRSLRVNIKINVSSNYFPLAILNISGLGSPNISTANLSGIKDTYYLGSLNPIFYGIAFTNAKVTLSLTDQGCDTTKSTDCTKTYSTITNQESRFGINIPKGDLKWGKKYTTSMFAAYNQDYNELPMFTLSTLNSIVKPQEIAPTPIPTPTPTSKN